ncbi:hypothetical protein R5R35_005743 [Gryllus longicercus]|uniref:G-protein coupled receptors family 2 profile 2 domain-containing protein n=1 Tax=Gryllus longicercus TaxID=2509291 RepID=A0AAN9ZHE0_9ORTH
MLGSWWVTALAVLSVVVAAGGRLGPKCCGAGERLDARLRRCEAASPPAEAHLPLRGHWPNCSDGLMLRLAHPSPDRVQWLANGSLVLRSPTARGDHATTTFDADDFCVDAAADSDSYALLLCPCSRLQCFSKCCPFGFVKRCDEFDCRCVESKDVWVPIHDDLELPEELDITYEILEDNEPICENGSNVWIDDPSKMPYHLTSVWWKYPDGLVFDPLKYCGDFVNRKNLPMYQTIGYCEKSFPFESLFDIVAIVYIPAAVLLMLTLVVVALVPEHSSSVYGMVHRRALICHALSLMISNTVLGSYVLSTNDTLYCLATPMIMYFSLVAAAFWLNVLCINLACGFNNPRGTQGAKGKSGRSIFFYYSVYAWGASATMTALTAYMWHGKRIPKGWLRPTLMETRTCYWEDESRKMGTFAYYYGPMSGLLIVNAYLFCCTILGVRRLRRNSAVLEENGNKRFSQSVFLYVKLLWVMGVAEMAAELAAWAVNGGGFYFNIAAEIIDLARAAAIFVLCACNRRTVRGLRRRLRFCASANAADGAQKASRQHAPQPSAKGDSVASHSSAATLSTLCDDDRMPARGLEMAEVKTPRVDKHTDSGGGASLVVEGCAGE